MAVVDEKKIEGSKATLSAWGRISVETAHELYDGIRALPESICDIDLDVSHVTYVSSAGMRAFIKANKLCCSRNGKLRLLYPIKEIDDVFQMTGLVDIVEIVHGGDE